MRRAALLGISVLLAVIAGWLLHSVGMYPREVSFMGAIFILAALLWTTEAIPLFATSFLVFGLQILLLANPGGWPFLGFESGHSPDYAAIIGAAADPVLFLFFGGFLLAKAAEKVGIDRRLSVIMLRPFGNRPAFVLFGVMLITGIFSMWMSNTATAAMMLTVVGPLLFTLERTSNLRKALLLGIAFAANIGGMATPIGSPPNLVAIGFLEHSEQPVDFLDWMFVGFPMATLLLGFAWWVLLKIFNPPRDPVSINIDAPRISPRGWTVIVVFFVTVILWLSDRLLGVPASVVALLPVIVFTTSGILDSEDLKSIEWDVLILIAGGISLGAGMQMSGLDDVIASWLAKSSFGGVALLLLLAVGTAALSTFMSNTAAANLLLPIGVSATTISSNIPLDQAAITLALAACLGFALPISTPPNAIAYSRGGLTVKDGAIPAILIGVFGLLLLMTVVPLLFKLQSLFK
jgi:sodium-dependent dicarboxylate transporter 2/3/5